MANDEVKVGMAEAKAKQLEEFRRSVADDDGNGGLFEIDVPRQQVWLFHRDVALRATEVMKLIGVHCRFKGKVGK